MIADERGLNGTDFAKMAIGTDNLDTSLAGWDRRSEVGKGCVLDLSVGVGLGCFGTAREIRNKDVANGTVEWQDSY